MGKGSSGISAGSGNMNVEWDQWGKVLEGSDIQMVYDKDGNVIGHIEDEIRTYYELEERDVTKSEVMKEIKYWKNDDGTYGDEDTKIFIAYDDGTFFDSEVLNGRNGYRSKLVNKGVIGASISTTDYEMVWGGERKRNGEISLWKTHASDENGNDIGKSNSYSGYKAVSQIRVRVKTTYNEKFQNGRPKVTKKTIRRSKPRKVEW